MVGMIAHERCLQYIPKILSIPRSRRRGRIFFESEKDAQERYEHEKMTAWTLAQFGYDVKFIEAVNTPGVKTPDCWWHGHRWEMKSPIGSKGVIVENAFASAARQSKYIIIDVRRMKRSVVQAMRDVMCRLKKRRGRIDFIEVVVLDRDYYCVLRKNMVKLR